MAQRKESRNGDFLSCIHAAAFYNLLFPPNSRDAERFRRENMTVTNSQIMENIS